MKFEFLATMHRLLTLIIVLLIATVPVLADKLFSATVDRIPLGTVRGDVVRTYSGKLHAGQHPINEELVNGITSFLFRGNRVFSMRGSTAQIGGLCLISGNKLESVKHAPSEA